MMDNVYQSNAGIAIDDSDCYQPDSLPEAVESVSKAQKQQASEIQQHQQLLATLQEELLQAQKHLVSLKEELRECLRKICLAQENHSKGKTHAQELQEAIDATVLENVSLKQMIKRTEADRIREDRMYKEYGEKMDKYKQAVLEMEANSPDHRELAKQKKICEDMEKKRAELKAEVEMDEESGELLAKRRLEDELHQLQITKADQQQKLNQLKQEITKENSKQAGIQQDIDVLQKRNKAQLTRLKCQLKEAQLRNWQWGQESEQLEAQLELLKKNESSMTQN
ncbi:golgin subfamily A member 2-like [Lytechinus variegatus]|uniref:golgin subfamily A member 2-like n=1 Tax=Lytechinus variegatus TaxID=7654 RepID=UPI001BB1907B|nr:golgin subfamily A member 2-like [Lytechinus variegatus]XP_041464947.1 golgin subfamily A member 2-like [Lytechinus variegatus]XP_041464949.1 golgin subfamily A member 2-like [Lytechinus variegatus]